MFTREMDTVEYKTLVQCRSKLVTAFKLDPGTIADELITRELIPPGVASDVTELTSSEQKARKLVDCVFAKVELSPKTEYDRFLSVLSQVGTWLDKVVGILNSTHSKQRACISRMYLLRKNYLNRINDDNLHVPSL